MLVTYSMQTSLLCILFFLSCIFILYLLTSAEAAGGFIPVSPENISLFNYLLHSYLTTVFAGIPKGDSMRSDLVAVWDEDRDYAARLSEYLRRHAGCPSRVVCYEEPEHLRAAVEAGRVAVAMAGRPVADSPWLDHTAVLTLTETREAAAGTVCKYQPAAQVARALMELGLWREQERGTAVRCARLRGIYSPLGGCMKTSLGLVMGSLLAEESSCLFISLEAHSGFRTLFERQYPVDLSDLFALMRRDGDLADGLPGALQSFGRLRYIPPVIWPEDVREAEKAELEKLLSALLRLGQFEEIVIDVGQDLARPEEVLGLCDRIYRPEKDDAFSRAKLAEYDAYLHDSGQEELLLRTEHIELGELTADGCGGSLSQWQRWEQMVPLVRRVLDREEQGDAGDD